MNLPRLRTGTIVSLAVLGAAGCGGGDDSSGGALSETEYRKKANALCKSVTTKVTDIPAPRSPDDIAGYLDKIVALNEETNADFKAIEPPSSLKKDHDSAVSSAEKQEPKLEAIADKARTAENPQTVVTRELSKLAPELKKEVAAAKRLGLDECLKTPGPTAGEESS